MTFIGEITIKVEFPEDYRAKEEANELTEEMANQIKIELQNKHPFPIHANATVYDEEEMRKEMESPDIHTHDRQHAVIPCFKCNHVDSDQRFEPCESCLASDDFKNFTWKE